MPAGSNHIELGGVPENGGPRSKSRSQKTPSPAGAAAAEGDLTLGQALLLARERNSAYRAARERVNIARGLARSRSAPTNPELSVGTTLVPDETEDPGEARSQFPDTDETNVKHTFPTSGRRRHRSRMAEAELTEATAELDRESLELRLRVQQAYLDLQLAQAAVGIHREASRLAASLHDATKGQQALGLVPETDTMRTRIEMAQAEQEFLKAAGESRTREEALGFLIGALSGAKIHATDSLIEGRELPELDQLRTMAVANRPEMRMALASFQAALADVALQKADRRPDLSIQASFLDHLTNSGNPPMKAWVSLPLWDRGAIGGQVERARAGVRMKEELLEQVERQVRTEVTTAHLQLEAARSTLAVSREEILPSARDLLEKARRAYVDGLGTLLQVLDAQRVLRQVSLDRLRAQGEVARALYQLERATSSNPEQIFTRPGEPGPEPGVPR